ncbi:serine/arginine repetitive matrix protein 3-like, partial [Herrania umbratica]|uniref:Serine/arginine repetitive matrix protein 3-like n=1 Tax=Herrania umbratica TaxID=108875 RepID=A0A6J1BMG0_9ROSI
RGDEHRGADAAEDRGPERAAELVAGLGDRRRRARALRRGRGHDDVVGQRLGERDPAAGEGEPGHDRGQGRRCGGEHHEAGGAEDEAPGDDRPQRQAPGDPRREQGARHAREHAGHHPQRRLERPVPEDQLQVLGEQQQQADQCDDAEQVGHHGRGERAVGQQRQVEQGVAQRPLTGDEGDPGADADRRREAGDQRRALGGDRLQRVDHGEHGDQGQARREQVERARVRVTALGQHERADREQGDRDGHRDEEDRVPREVLEQPPADHRPGGRAPGERRRPHRDGAATGPRLGEHGLDQRQRRGHQRRPADPEQRAGGDERLGAGGERGRDRGQTEGRGPDEQQLPAPDAVAQPAHDDEQPREDERVDVDHPELLRPARREVRVDGGQRRTQDRHVDADEQDGQRQHRERDPRPHGHDLLRIRTVRTVQLRKYTVWTVRSRGASAVPARPRPRRVHRHRRDHRARDGDPRGRRRRRRGVEGRPALPLRQQGRPARGPAGARGGAQRGRHRGGPRRPDGPRRLLPADVVRRRRRPELPGHDRALQARLHRAARRRPRPHHARPLARRARRRARRPADRRPRRDPGRRHLPARHRRRPERRARPPRRGGPRAPPGAGVSVLRRAGPDDAVPLTDLRAIMLDRMAEGPRAAGDRG